MGLIYIYSRTLQDNHVLSSKILLRNSKHLPIPTPQRSTHRLGGNVEGLDVTDVAADLLGALVALLEGAGVGGLGRLGLLGLAGGGSGRRVTAFVGGSGSGSRGGSGGGLGGGAGRLSGSAGSSRRRAAALGGSAGRLDGRGGLRDSRGTRDQSRSGDGVAVEGSVDVEENAIIVGSIQLSAQGALGRLGATTSDAKAEALGVVLSTVLLAGRVKSNDLVAEDVVTRGNALRDLDHPSDTIVQELVGTIGAGGGRAINETDLANLEEFEGGLVDRGTTGITAAGEVVDDGAVVRIGPGVPLDVDGVTSSNLGEALGVLAALVADDVGVGEGVRGNEAKISGLGAPADDNGSVVTVREVGHIVTGVLDAVDDEGLDVAVSGSGGSASKGSSEGLDGGRHLDD